MGGLATLVKKYEAPLLAFLQDLVRLKSVNGRHSEQAVAERIVIEANYLDLPVQIVAKELLRPNVLVRWGNGSHGFALIGHMDTVAAGDATQWTSPPFVPEIRNGRLYGRGTADQQSWSGDWTLHLGHPA